MENNKGVSGECGRDRKQWNLRITGFPQGGTRPIGNGAIIKSITKESISDSRLSLAQLLAQPRRGQPRNGFTFALEYVSETVFKHRMFVVLGIESKSQSSSEKTWLGTIGLSNFLIQRYSFPVCGPLHLGTEAGLAAKHRGNTFALSQMCWNREER